MEDRLSTVVQQRQIYSTELRCDGRVVSDVRQALKKKLESAKDSPRSVPPEKLSPVGSTPLPQRPASAPPHSSLPVPPAKKEEEPKIAKTDSERSRAAASPAAELLPPAPTPPVLKEESSVIGAGTQLRGILAYSGRLVVNGGFAGRIHTREGALRIGPEGEVQAEIEAADILVEGKVRGGIAARNAVELRTGADVEGSIRCLRLQVDAEAAFLGACECYRPVTQKQEPAIRRPDLYGFFTAMRVASVRL